MKVYALRNGVKLEADVPDGAIWLEIDSQDDGHGHRLNPIVEIDHNNRTYRRSMGVTQPWPEGYYFERDIKWREMPEATQEP